MGAHPAACACVTLLVVVLAAVQRMLLLLLQQVDAHLYAADAAAANLYVSFISAVSVFASGIVFDRYFKRCTVYSLAHECTVHYKQTSHATAALAVFSFGCAFALLLMLHPLSPTRTTPHRALVHVLLAARSLAASAMVAPSIASVARSTAPHALPLAFSAMLLGETAAHALLVACPHCAAASALFGYSVCAAASALFGYSVWAAAACPAVELLMSCAMILLERLTAVSAHVRVLGYEFQKRGHQVMVVTLLCRPPLQTYSDSAEFAGDAAQGRCPQGKEAPGAAASAAAARPTDRLCGRSSACKPGSCSRQQISCATAEYPRNLCWRRRRPFRRHGSSSADHTPARHSLNSV